MKLISCLVLYVCQYGEHLQAAQCLKIPYIFKNNTRLVVTYTHMLHASGCWYCFIRECTRRKTVDTLQCFKGMLIDCFKYFLCTLLQCDVTNVQMCNRSCYCSQAVCSVSEKLRMFCVRFIAARVFLYNEICTQTAQPLFFILKRK